MHYSLRKKNILKDIQNGKEKADLNIIIKVHEFHFISFNFNCISTRRVDM